MIDALADENDPASRADAETLLQVLADGVLITEKNIVDNLESDALWQLDDARGYAKLGLSLRWLLWVLVLLPLIGIGFIGSNKWAGRLKWAGGVAAVSALIVYAGISIGWSIVDIANDRIPDYKTDISAEFRADYPRLTTELVSDEPVARLQRALDSWQRGWRNQTIPWIVVGIVAFGAGFFLDRGGTPQRDTLRKSDRPSPAATTAAGVPPETVVAVAEDGEDEAPGSGPASGPQTIG